MTYVNIVVIARQRRIMIALVAINHKFEFGKLFCNWLDSLLFNLLVVDDACAAP